MMQFKTSQDFLQNCFLSSINLTPLTLDRQTDITYTDFLKLSYLRRNDSWKMEVLKIFVLWVQEIDSRFMNHEPLIPNL